MSIEGSGSCVGVLQPVTSVVSTLSLLKPQHHSQLLNKLVNPPPCLLPAAPPSSSTTSKESAKTNSMPAKFVSVPLKSKRQLATMGYTRTYRTASQVLQNVLEQSSGVAQEVLREEGKLGLASDGVREEREGSSMRSESCPEGSGFMARCVSDSELYTGLQLLFRETKPHKSMHK